MTYRMETVELTDTFEGVDAYFPYTSAQLAAALTQMINSNYETETEKSADEDRIDLFSEKEEVKKEETLSQAIKSGHMM